MLHHPERLEKVHPDLAQLIRDVGVNHDLIVIEGARSLEDEKKAIATGHSALKDPMRSKHVIDPDKRPLALAVDIGPYPLVWTNIEGFKKLGAAAKELAAARGLSIRWGGDWTKFKDMPHVELA